MSAATMQSPALPSLEYPAIAELASLDQWVCFELPSKTPLRTNGSWASSTDPKTWSTFEAVCTAFMGGVGDGIGFVFSAEDDIVGVDFDGCLDDAGRITDPIVANLVRELDSFTEVSVSGRGLHVYVKGSLRSGTACVGFEVYPHGRYFAATGRHYPGTPETIEWRQHALDTVVATIRSRKKSSPTVSTSIDPGEKIGEGGRNTAVYNRARRRYWMGLRGAELIAAVHAFNAESCDPPLPDAEVVAVVANVERNVQPFDPGPEPSWATDSSPDHVEKSPPSEVNMTRGLDVEALAFTGDKLIALLQRPEPPPIHAGLPVRGHLRVLVAPSFSGKTSLSLWCAAARAKGVAPWTGAPTPEAGRVLLLSIDEAPEQVVRRLRSLGHFHPAGRVETYADNLMVIGPDRDTEPEILEALRFTDAGLAILEGWIGASWATARPIVEVSIDAYADMIPIGETENSNEEGTRIGGALERIAVRTGTAITLLHHAGKPRVDRGDGPQDLRTLGRGASALAAKARTITSIEEMPGFPHLRRVRTITNLARAPRDLVLQVCSEDADAPGLDFFRSYDPLAAYRPHQYIEVGEQITTNALAWRISGLEPEGGKQAPGEAKKLAAELRAAWLDEGLIQVVPGPRGAKLVSLTGGSIQ